MSLPSFCLCMSNKSDYTNNMVYQLTYHRNDRDHAVVVTVKRIKNIIFRYKDGSFLVSTPKNTPTKVIFDYLDRFYDRLLAKDAKKTSPFENGKMFLLGQSVELYAGEDIKNVFRFGDALYFKDDKDFDKKLRLYAKDYFTSRVRYFEKVMKIKNPYEIKVRDMKTRFGTNSRKTHALSFQLRLIHFQPEIIDAIVIHELAHDHHFDHGVKFYQKLYEFCPNYKALIKKLKKGEFA